MRRTNEWMKNGRWLRTGMTAIMLLAALGLAGAAAGGEDPSPVSTKVSVFRSGAVRVWGENHTYPDADHDRGEAYPRVQASLETATDMAFGGFSCIAALKDGGYRVWGDCSNVDFEELRRQAVKPAAETLDAVSIAAGYSHFLLAHKDGTVSAWGDNSKGQCKVPEGLTDVLAVAAGRWHSLALKKDGTVIAWGDNRLGQCQVPGGLAKVRKIRAGWFHSLALLEDGSLRAWGFNHDRQTEIPKNLPPVADIMAGAAHTIVLLANGDVRLWGSDDCGLVSTGNKLRGIKAIASGANHCIALGKDGIHLWGQNCFGQTSRPGIEGEVVAVFAGENTTGVILAQPEPEPQP